jgi:hypothetical protein
MCVDRDAGCGILSVLTVDDEDEDDMDGVFGTLNPKGLCVEDVLLKGEGSPPSFGESGGVSKYHFLKLLSGVIGLFVPDRELPAWYPLLLPIEEQLSVLLDRLQGTGTVNVFLDFDLYPPGPGP